MQRNKLIKNLAANLDIDLCRITDGTELKEKRELLEKRSRGKYWPQPFTNQDLEELTKPALHFPNLKSIIVIAVNYNNKGDSSFLSNYITVSDYHNYLEYKLKKLAAKLKQKLNINFKFKIFVDNAPFLEKAVAERAGIGFIGKNTLLINPELGSNLFLGEMFTDLEVETDEALEMDCGNCRLCIENCKVNALKDEYLLVAEECTAYLTQKKGILSEKEIQKIGSHIWGCDDCKDVCPYNISKAESRAEEMQFFERELEYFLNLERKNLPVKLKNTAMSWRGSRILLRNAMLVASNLGEEKYFQLIKNKLNDNSPVIRYYAAYSLAKINFKRARKIIKKQIKIENNKKYKQKLESILELEEDKHEY